MDEGEKSAASAGTRPSGRKEAQGEERGRGRDGPPKAFVYVFTFQTFLSLPLSFSLPTPHALQFVRGAGLGGCWGVPFEHGCAAGRSRRLPAACRRRSWRRRSDRSSVGIFGSPTTPLASSVDASRGQRRQQRRRGGPSSQKRPSRCLLAELPLRLGVRGGRHGGARRQRQPPA